MAIPIKLVLMPAKNWLDGSCLFKNLEIKDKVL